MTRHDWSRYDPTLAALPKPAPAGKLDELAAEWGIKRASLEWRLRWLRGRHGRGLHRRWTDAEDARLEAAIRALARELDRTPGAVVSRAAALGLRE